MKKLVLTITFIIVTLVLLVAGIYLYLTDFGRKFILANEPRKPRLEVPVTYTIDWWTDQKNLQLFDFKIDIIEAKLNLFNKKSLISYTLSGEISHPNSYAPKIGEVHISERLNNDTSQHYDRIIEITPIVILTKDDEMKEGNTFFKFKNEHTILSNKMGKNKIKFICGSKEQLIELFQTK